MNKEFEYKNHNFNIQVELNARVERRLDGKREHEITINCMDLSNFYMKKMCETHNLYNTIEDLIKIAKKSVDEKELLGKTDEEIILFNLGFK